MPRFCRREITRSCEQIGLCGSKSDGDRSARDGNDARNDHAETGDGTEKVEISAQVTTRRDRATPRPANQSGTATIRELPLATQNYQQLLTLSTGAQSDLNAAAQLGRGSVKLFVNGQREDNNNFLIEGISATDYNVAQATYVPLPNPDVIQEFKVQTSLYDASQGRNGGGNVNAILKSGTKQLSRRCL